MNYTTLATTKEQSDTIIEAIENGFTDDKGVKHRPNKPIAFALRLERVLGCRIGDISKMRPCDIVKDGEFYRLNIKEEKTGKSRRFLITEDTFNIIQAYCEANKISDSMPIIGKSVRTIQNHLKHTTDALNMPHTSTHSFRKQAACEIYELTGNDIEATRLFLNHSSVTTTSRYLSKSNTTLQNALAKMNM